MDILAQRLIDVVSETYLIDQSQLDVGCSIGGAMGPSDGRTVEELLKRSDLALSHAKSDGRGIHRHFDLDLQKKIDHRHDMARTLREALAEDQFELHRSEDHTSELQSLMRLPHAAFCLTKK